MSLIEVRDLVYSYDNEHNAVEGVSFDIKEGDYVTIIGHNGSGKAYGRSSGGKKWHHRYRWSFTE